MRPRYGFRSLATASAFVSLLACNAEEEALPEPQVQVTSMTQTRAWHSMTVLPSGRVLVAGGFMKVSGRSYVTLPSAELYDPSDGTWSVTGSMTTARYGHAAVLLDSGTVLIAGGESMDDFTGHVALTSAEIYDPDSGTFAPTGAMLTPRAGAAVLLPSGRVLGLGGVAQPELDTSENQVVGAAELYDPDTGTWSATGSMLTPRHFHYAAAVLPSGEVLVVGGSTSTQTFGATETAEIYSETTGTFRAAPPLDYPVAAASAAPLPRGDVLLVGGCIGGDGYCSSDDVTARIYDVAAGSWRNTASLFWGRETAAALPLASGKILVVGGTMYSDGSVCTEVFDPATETWSWSDPLRHDHGNGAAAVLLPGGDLLVSGGALMLAMPLDTTRVDQATIRVAERFRP